MNLISRVLSEPPTGDERDPYPISDCPRSDEEQTGLFLSSGARGASRAPVFFLLAALAVALLLRYDFPAVAQFFRVACGWLP